MKLLIMKRVKLFFGRNNPLVGLDLLLVHTDFYGF